MRARGGGAWLLKWGHCPLDAFLGKVIAREEKKWRVNKHIDKYLFAEVDQARSVANFFAEWKLAEAGGIFE